MSTLVDDIGSFPLPVQVDRESFDKAYLLARKAMIDGKDVRDDEFLLKNFCEVIVDSFGRKIETGLDVVSYPQHYDMYKQLADVLKGAMDECTYLVDEKHAFLPEVLLIEKEAKRFWEKFGKRIELRVCMIGPMELYLRQIGTTDFSDVLAVFAEDVKRFAKNSLLNNRYVRTAVVSLDEPSFGFQEISADRDVILDVLEAAFDFRGVVRQIHLHSPSRITDILPAKNIDVLSFEYAASPKSIEGVSRRMLDQADKQIRVGVSRTDVDSIMAELYGRGVTKPDAQHFVEEERTIRKRFISAKEKYGDRMTYTGPDCGLGGWPSQEAALLLLKRTVNAVKTSSNSA